MKIPPGAPERPSGPRCLNNILEIMEEWYNSLKYIDNTELSMDTAAALQGTFPLIPIHNWRSPVRKLRCFPEERAGHKTRVLHECSILRVYEPNQRTKSTIYALCCAFQLI
jgi:hypothetical protein